MSEIWLFKSSIIFSNYFFFTTKNQQRQHIHPKKKRNSVPTHSYIYIGGIRPIWWLHLHTLLWLSKKKYNFSEEFHDRRKKRNTNAHLYINTLKKMRDLTVSTRKYLPASHRLQYQPHNFRILSVRKPLEIDLCWTQSKGKFYHRHHRRR